MKTCNCDAIRANMNWRQAVAALHEGRLTMATRRAIAAKLEPFANAEADRERAQKSANHNPNDPCCECAVCWQECEGGR